MAEKLTLFEKPERFEKFKQQAFKDFELAGVTQYLPNMDTHTLLQLETSFYQSVLKLEMSNALKNLLYRIDITELQIKTASFKNPTTPLQHILAELMIKRILQKVILKELYSK